MTVITKTITEKKAADIVELPLVVDEIPGDESRDCPEGQYVGRTTHYVLSCRQRAKRLNSLTTLCLFLTALLVMSIGVIGGVYIYKQYARVQMHRFRGWCEFPYAHKALHQKDGLIAKPDLDDTAAVAKEAMELEKSISDTFKEGFEIDLENEDYEKIDVPDLRGGRQGRFIHDFNTNKTGIIDMDGHRCFVMPLDRKRVLPPRNLFDLLKKMYGGYYEVDTEVVRESMRVITPRISDLTSLGTFIARECRDYPTYKLEKFVHTIDKRSIMAGATFAQFAGMNVMEWDIMNMNEVQAYEEKSRNEGLMD